MLVGPGLANDWLAGGGVGGGHQGNPGKGLTPRPFPRAPRVPAAPAPPSVDGGVFVPRSCSLNTRFTARVPL